MHEVTNSNPSSQEFVTLGLSLPLSVLIGFVLGTAGTFCFQRFLARDGLFMAFWKGLLAGVTVGVPFPIAGGVIGAWILVLAGLRLRESRTSTDAR
jgi:hypothetical protein